MNTFTLESANSRPPQGRETGIKTASSQEVTNGASPAGGMWHLYLFKPDEHSEEFSQGHRRGDDRGANPRHVPPTQGLSPPLSYPPSTLGLFKTKRLVKEHLPMIPLPTSPVSQPPRPHQPQIRVPGALLRSQVASNLHVPSSSFCVRFPSQPPKCFVFLDGIPLISTKSFQ